MNLLISCCLIGVVTLADPSHGPLKWFAFGFFGVGTLVGLAMLQSGRVYLRFDARGVRGAPHVRDPKPSVG